MLSLHSKPKQTNLDESLVPAINIVFLLLIFFMVAGQISKQYGNVELPTSQSDSALDLPLIEIRIEAADKIFLNGQLLQQDLLGALRELAFTPETPVICFVERSLPAEVLDAVLDGARTLGLKRLSIATELQQ